MSDYVNPKLLIDNFGQACVINYKGERCVISSITLKNWFESLKKSGKDDEYIWNLVNQIVQCAFSV